MNARRAAARVALLLLAALCARAQGQRLDSGWQFLADQSGALKVSDLSKAPGWRDVRVGLSWNAQFEDLRDYMGVAWYRATINAPDLAGGRRALLRFGACDYFAEVFVNGKSVGTHEGGYTPFTFDVTGALRAGANEVAVRVIDPPMDERENRARFPQFLYDEIPHGKQNWYVQTGGLWQPVWLEVKPQVYIKAVRVQTKLARLESNPVAVVSVSVELSAPLTFQFRYGDPKRPVGFAHAAAQVPVTAQVQITDAQGRRQQLPLAGGADNIAIFSDTVRQPLLWQLDQPNLYTVEASTPGPNGDHVTTRFGLRTFEARDGKFYLNGEPFYMRAALDQDFYPETIYTPPSKEYVREQMLKGKRMGLNLLRCHIKVCSPEYLEAADEVGVLVWYEIPSWNDGHHFAEVAARRGEKTFEEMVARDWNHPSIVIQSIINEGWGADLPHGEDSRRWLRAEFDRAKQLTAPTGRLIVDNSACCDNFHLKTDIEDNHRYNSIPDYYRDFDKWIEEFSARPKWDFSPFGDAQATGREPLVVSEFGNWGLPNLPKQLPWWFGRDFGGRPVTRPAGLFDRFNEYRFASVFGDYDGLARETQWHQFASLKHEIEEIRARASIQGYVITEFTDINWEANGLMSMWREPKAYAADLAKLQQDDLITARTDKHNYTSGEPVVFDALLSHYSGRDLRSAQLVWRVEGGAQQSRQVISQDVAPASVTTLARHSFTAPQVARPQRALILLEVRDRAGAVVAENSAEIFVYPKPPAAKTTPLMFYAPDQKFGWLAAPQQPKDIKRATPLLGHEGPFGDNQPQLLKALSAAGYPTEPWLSQDNHKSLLIATVVDEHVEKFLRGGGTALVLANAPTALPPRSSLKIAPREGSDLDGNWVTNFNWVRAAAPSPFASLAFTKVLGFESEHVVPRFIIQGVRGADYDDVLSGIFYGWLNNNAALAAQARVGQGRLVLTTFRFDDYGRDPYATHLLDAFIRYASGPGCAPKMSLDAALARGRCVRVNDCR